MNRFTKYAFATSVLFSLTVKAQLNIQLQDTLQSTLENYASAHDMQGVSSAVVFPDGSKWSGVSGEYAAETSPGNYTLEPLTTDLLYDIGSNTKSMTSALILLLEEENELSIDDTLYTYINPVEHVPFGITIKQLLQHQSGLASFTDHPDFGAFANDEASPFLSPDSVLSRFLAPPLYPVGSTFYYSNTNYLLLGKVIESIENTSFHEVLQERIFTPYQLDNMFLDQYQDYAPLVKTGTWFGTTSFDPYNYIGFMSAAWSAGAVVSKPEDFASYCYQLGRGDILSPTSMVKMTSGISSPFGNYGLGLIKKNYKGKEYLMHGGKTLQNSEMHYSLSSDFSVVTLNIDYNFTSETRSLQNELIDVLEALLPEALSIHESQTEAMVSIYPNPSTDILHIEFINESTSAKKNIEIYNQVGQLVYTVSTNESRLNLYKSEIGTGIYFMRIREEDNLLTRKKIIFN